MGLAIVLNLYKSKSSKLSFNLQLTNNYYKFYEFVNRLAGQLLVAP